MTLAPMTCQDLPPLLTLSGAVLEAQWDRVGHITLLDRCRRPVGREKKKTAMSHFWDTHHRTDCCVWCFLHTLPRLATLDTWLQYLRNATLVGLL